MIGGNIDLILKEKVLMENEIGERVATYQDYKTIKGFLDFMNETTNHNNNNSKVVESTHVFICDYVAIDKSERDLIAICNNQEFDVKYIDNPMNLNKHLEIFLDYLGD